MKILKFKNLAYFLPSLIIMVAIFLFSAQDADESSDLSGSVTYTLVSGCDHLFNIDMDPEELMNTVELLHNTVRKIAHFTEYCILGISLAIPITKFHKCTWRTYFATLTICVLYATSDEIHQLFVAGRYGSPKDVFIDSMGALFGLSIIFMLRKSKL